MPVLGFRFWVLGFSLSLAAAGFSLRMVSLQPAFNWWHRLSSLFGAG
jgi:hypothetical protein